MRLPRLVVGEPPLGLDLLRVEGHDDPTLLADFSCELFHGGIVCGGRLGGKEEGCCKNRPQGGAPGEARGCHRVFL